MRWSLQRPPADQPRPWTYANLALVRRTLVAGIPPGQRAALGPLLFASAEAGRLGGEVLSGAWHNVGTPAQLAAVRMAAEAAGGPVGSAGISPNTRPHAAS